MAQRKNTAQAFEVLYRIAQEDAARRAADKAAAEALAATPTATSSAAAPAGPAGAAEPPTSPPAPAPTAPPSTAARRSVARRASPRPVPSGSAGVRRDWGLSGSASKPLARSTQSSRRGSGSRSFRGAVDGSTPSPEQGDTRPRVPSRVASFAPHRALLPPASLPQPAVPEQIPILIEASLDRGHEAADSTFDERRALLADDALSGGEFFAGSGGGEPLDHAGASEAVAEIGRPPVDLALFDGAHAAWPASRSQGPAGAHGFQLLEVREPFPGGRGRQEKGGAPAIPSPVAGRDVVPAEPMSMSGTGPLAGGAAAESIVRSASPSASLPAERADGDASRAAARDAGTLVNGPAGAASRDLPRGGRAFLSAFWHGSSHAIGEGSSTILERRVEMRLSTVLVAAMAMIVVTTLVLTYLRMDSPPDPLLPDGRLTSLPAPSSGELSARLSKGEAGAEALPPTRPDDSVGASSAADSLAAGGAGAQGRSETALRKMPIWGPASSARPMTPEELAASPPARPIPDVRNVESIAAATSAGDPSKEGAARTEAGVLEGRAAAEEDAAASDSPNFYIIQVRAKESWEGAQRIVEHLGVFGFDKPLVEQDRGGHSAYADKLYTVFVGRYYDKEQADRECRRLKRETRQRPYKDREDFFQDSLVITRTR